VVWYIVILWDGSQFQVVYLDSGGMGIDSEDLHVERAWNWFLSSQQICNLFLRIAVLSFGVKSVLKSDQ
jgi:hypothetical protein